MTELASFRRGVSRHAMQAAWVAVFGTENLTDDPSAASIRFIDEVIVIAGDESLPIGRRIERLENRLAQYLKINSVAAPQRARPDLKLV
jgi:hypothetical protein